MTRAMIEGRAPAPVDRPGFLVVRTPDVDRLVDHYEDALGLVVAERAASSAYLTTGAEHHCIVIEQGRADGRAALGFSVSADLGEVQAALSAAGVGAELRHDEQPGIGASLVIAEPGTGTPLSLYEQQEQTGGAASLGVRPSKLGHVASYVEDLERAQAFYTDVLGFRWSDTIGDFFTFLRCNADHHAINLMRSSTKSGLFHVAFEMRDVVHLKDALDHLAARSIRLQWGPGRHGAGHNIFTYHHDPDGNLVELFTEIDRIADERTGRFEPRPWHEKWPQGPQFWNVDVEAANKWGPVDPEMLVH
ncbi:VOC family protein [Amnibacterium kyonggiense]